MKRPETQYAQCGDLSIAYQVFGEGPIDLLHAQGWLTNVEFGWESPHWTRFHTRLAQFARVIVFDKRGMGLSDGDYGAPTFDDRADDINAVLDAVGSERAAILGTSEGGSIAAVYAATHPHRVSSLILYASYAKGLWSEDYPWGETEEYVEKYLVELRKNWGKPFDMSGAAPSAASDPVASQWFASYLRQSSSPRAAVEFTRLTFDVDVRSVLPAITVPTLVIQREGDQWMQLEEAHFLANNIKTAKQKILEGNDHIPFFGDQETLIGEIEEFLTGGRHLASTNRMLLTVLMVDMVDSTSTVRDLGDDHWRTILEQFDYRVTKCMDGYGGTKIKHTGDGYLLTFSGPTRAIECAFTLSHEAEKLGLRLRSGIHTGECEIRGDDIHGLAVHVAARIMGEAKPGQVLTSSTVKDLAIGSSLEFSQLEPRELKGLDGSWVLYSV